MGASTIRGVLRRRKIPPAPQRQTDTTWNMVVAWWSHWTEAGSVGIPCRTLRRSPCVQPPPAAVVFTAAAAAKTFTVTSSAHTAHI
ncbi:hypothetical protein CG723_24040 [Streptomyces sp. CB01635]|nr:hypothetical protein CG723_24040 [Streptomyces sp. CB01635]